MHQPAESTNRIIILDEHTTNRIAAGEVVERPVSVVKELVENSIDAGATQIIISLEQGGKELIKVTDNGCGMTREDAVLSLQRHATSKIKTAEDLQAIRTLGFRGEALPSIASVSLMEMITKHESEPAAVRLEVEAGTIVNLESAGAPQGTTISVRQLFFNTPARLKFLKSTQTELSHIAECVGWFAMAYPTISFRLLHGGREVFCSPGTGMRINSVAEVLGKDVAKQLIPIRYESATVRVEGFISTPSLTRVTRRDQTYFVNGRPIRSKTIAHAVDYAYRGLITAGRYPVVVLFLEIEPQLVDVNVHPAKSEVKFSDEREVHSVVHRAINAALMSGAAAPAVFHITPGPKPKIHERAQTVDDDTADSSTFHRNHVAHSRDLPLANPNQPIDLTAFEEALRRRREEALAGISNRDAPVWQKGTGVPVEESPVPDAGFETLRTVALTGVRIIGQAKNTYIIAECDDGVLVIDQHVAHERVLFDRILRSDLGRGSAVQRLITPVTLSLSARESAIVRQRLDQLRQAGFEVEEFGRNTFIVRAVPAQLKTSEAEQILRDIITELVDLSVERHLVVRPEQVFITTACKMAIKAGQKLSDREMTKLIEDLLKCENPFVCPHGRPIIVSLPNWELDRKFKRA